MRILFVGTVNNVKIPPDRYGGAELVQYNLVRTLEKFGHEVILVALRGSYKANGGLIEIEPEPEIRPTSLKIEQEKVLGKKEVIDAVKSADVVIDDSDYKQVAQYVFDKFEHKKAMCYYSNGTFWHFPETHKNCVAVSKAHALMAVYCATGYEGFQFPAQSMINSKGLLIDVCEYLYPAFFPDEYEFNPTPKDYILCFGRFHPDKGFDIALKVADTMPDTKFILAGSIDLTGQKEYYESILSKARHLSNVEVIASPSTQEKIELFKNAKAFFNPVGLTTGYMEAFGLTNAESLLCGTPIIGTPSGGMVEIIEHGKNGFVFVNDPTLKKAFMNINKIKREDCRKSGERFSFQNVYLKAEQLLLRVKSGDYW